MKFIHYLILACIIQVSCSQPEKTHLKFDRLLCEYSVEPGNIDTKMPRFSWTVSAEGRNRRQSAYRVLVATQEKLLESGKADMWDSGKRKSDTTMHIGYKGSALESNRKYYWKVMVWDERDRLSLSEVTHFSTALIHQDDWRAKWIGANSTSEPHPERGFFSNPKEEKMTGQMVSHDGRSVLLRRDFGIGKKVISARLFITGLGFYEAEINGKRVGDHVLSPAKTPYHKFILYDTYDIMGLLKNGQNVIGIRLGNGWYNPYKKWWATYRMQWFGYKKAIAQLHIKYADGSSEVIITDDRWKWHYGPVLYNCVYDGEVYDANAEQDGWSSPGFDDSAWGKAVIMDKPAARLLSGTMPPIRVVEVKKPVKVTELQKGAKVYDLGQNFAGWVRVTMKGSKGTRVRFRFSEVLNDDGTLDLTCNENARATAEYIMRGGEEEVYESRFTYFGFQYVEVSVIEGALPDIISLEGCVVHSDNEQVGSFECSHPLINRMHHATVWSQKSNMIGYPMDCPQRDERLGWMGDAQVTAEEAMFNFDMALFYENWFRGIRANQDEQTGDIPIISPRPYLRDDGVEWSSSYIIMVWQHFLQYGDRRVLEENYHAMKRYMDFLAEISSDYIVPKGWIGDWGSMVEGWEEGEPESVPTAYYFFNASILANVAEVLGHENEAILFLDLAQRIRKAYNEAFYDKTTKNYNDRSQMANAFPLFLGLAPDQDKQVILANLIRDIIDKNDTHLTTGVLGTKYIFEALSKFGRNDVGWALATQTSYPSWAAMMKQFNTMCEFWTLKQSHNHVMMGSIDAWFYKELAGIRVMEDAPAFGRFVIKPFVAEGLHYARASTRTIRGMVSSSWKKSENGFEIVVEVPYNTTAVVYIPADEDEEIFEGERVLKDAEGVAVKGYENGYKVIEAGSGSYHFHYGK